MQVVATSERVLCQLLRIQGFLLLLQILGSCSAPAIRRPLGQVASSQARIPGPTSHQGRKNVSRLLPAHDRKSRAVLWMQEQPHWMHADLPLPMAAAGGTTFFGPEIRGADASGRLCNQCWQCTHYCSTASYSTLPSDCSDGHLLHRRAAVSLTAAAQGRDCQTGIPVSELGFGGSALSLQTGGGCSLAEPNENSTTERALARR